ncbi:MAG: caspase family protein [Alphaproteobacteria bacterium]|nr:caspase family protein [Alphaproteobacteria bacterium]
MARFAAMMRVAALALLGLLVAVARPVQAQSAATGEPRLALVIGNAAYDKQALKNPANDARAVAQSLRKLGFTVIERVDAGKKAMEDAILEFGEKLKAGGVGLFYYAGHGVQVRGHNYLVPLDASLPSEASVRVQAVDVDLVLEQMTEARNRANVVILDACRNNPFMAARRGAGAGLAAIDAARGTLIAYSTAPGTVAVDGSGANSPYTASLVRAIEQPGLTVEELFKRVRSTVLEATQGAQTPWESSSLTGDLVLNLNVTINVPAATATATPAPAPAPANSQAAQVAFWETMGKSGNPGDYEEYLRQFPDGIFAGLAKRRIADLKRAQTAAAAPPPRPAAVPAPAAPPAPAPAAPPAAAPVAAAAPPSPYTQEAAAPVPSASELRQRSYERVITILLGQTVATGTDQGKRNDYRAAPRPKAIAACIDWSGGSPDAIRVGSWASSWIPPGAVGTPPRQDALEKCTRGNNTPARCMCQVVDENDANALDLPQDFQTRALRR